MHVAIITAGGAGMFCGSCMHDNTWARSLRAAGVEVTLLPTYTPIRVDEQDISSQHVFFGGINVYLKHRFRRWRLVPQVFTRWLDQPWIINLATRFGVSNDAHYLGAITIEMLQGESGPHNKAVDDLVDFISGQLKPDVVCFSNVLLVGALRELKQRFDGKVYCALQGDDIFLDALNEPYRQEAIEIVRQRAQEFDGFLVHSQYYLELMSDYLSLARAKCHLIPLGIDLSGHDGQPDLRKNDHFTIGYFARICPEKGLQRLVESFRILNAKQPQTLLKVGGYCGKRDQKFFSQMMRDAEEFGAAFRYVGSPKTHEEKVAFLKSLDVLCVPTVYKEPKGLYVLEALANGVPVVQPRHGAFPELIEATGGGLLVDPGNAEELALALETLMQDSDRRKSLAAAGHAKVRELFGAQRMAQRSISIFEGNL